MSFIDFLIKNNIHELILFILIGLTIYIILKKLLLTNNEKINRKQKTMKKLIVNILKYIIIIFLILKLLTIIGINVSSIIAGLGIASVIIGLALQDIMKDVLSGIFIIIENQYDVGDEVEINKCQGYIIDLGLRSTRIKTFDSDIVTIANRNISVVKNCSREKPTVMIDLPFPYETPNQKVLEMLDNIKIRVEKELQESVKELSILGLQTFADSCIKYRIMYEAKKDQRYKTKRAINMIIKEEYDKSKISIQYNILEVRNGK